MSRTGLAPLRRCLLGTLNFVVVASSVVATSVASATAPAGSWEAWLVELRLGASPPPARPDSKNISLPLPLWVDCHLSWAADRPKSKTRAHLSGEIVLVGNSKLCRGQLEEWAIE